MAQYIYSRVSTDKQDVESQLMKLKELYPDAAVFEETASGIKTRPVLNALLTTLQSGDTLITYSLDRLGRRTSEVLALIEGLEKRGIVLKTIREGVDYSSIAGKLVTQILCSVAELERNLISERTKLALEARRRQGVQLGRKRSYSDEVIAKVKALRASGLTVRAISQRTGVSPAWVAKLTRETSELKPK